MQTFISHFMFMLYFHQT